MTAVTEMGGINTPPLPAFYQSKTSQDDLVGHKVGRILDLLGVASEGLVGRAGEGWVAQLATRAALNASPGARCARLAGVR